MNQRRQYRKPPVLEAVCEIRFDPTREWDWTVPGLLYDKIKDQFPEKKLQNTIELSFGGQQGPQQFKGAVSQMQFLTNDKSAMVQVGPDVLTVRVTAKYPGWEGFSPLIARAAGVYQTIADPKGIGRIGLRYVNRIVIPGEGFEITDYFNFYPHIPKTVPQVHGAFTVGVLFGYDEQRDILNVKLGNIEPTGVVLDLDYYLAKAGAVGLDKVSEWVNMAHDRLETMFEACITDKTRHLFDDGEIAK
jgi:uncharacterized protein (TIGR04255 family)